MSDSETKQLHIFMRKGLKGTYIDKSEIHLFSTRNRDIFLVRYIKKIPTKTLSPTPQQTSKGLTRKRAKYQEVVKIIPAK